MDDDDVDDVDGAKRLVWQRYWRQPRPMGVDVVVVVVRGVPQDCGDDDVDEGGRFGCCCC